MAPRILISTLWLAFCILWAGRSLVVRRGRNYSNGKKRADRNARYHFVSNFVFVLQITLTFPLIWFRSPWLLQFHDDDSLRFAGLAFCFAGLALSIWSLVKLGRNYSPCYDSHEPFELIVKGPYRFIRHPGWLSKWMVGMGGVLVSGSWWFVPILLWLFVETRRTIRVEEDLLMRHFPNYRGYAEKTARMIPGIY